MAIEFQVTDGHDHAVMAACPDARTRPRRFAPGTTAAQAVVCALLGPISSGVTLFAPSRPYLVGNPHTEFTMVVRSAVSI